MFARHPRARRHVFRPPDDIPVDRSGEGTVDLGPASGDDVVHAEEISKGTHEMFWGGRSENDSASGDASQVRPERTRRRARRFLWRRAGRRRSCQPPTIRSRHAASLAERPTSADSPAISKTRGQLGGGPDAQPGCGEVTLKILEKQPRRGCGPDQRTQQRDGSWLGQSGRLDRFSSPRDGRLQRLHVHRLRQQAGGSPQGVA